MVPVLPSLAELEKAIALARRRKRPAKINPDEAAHQPVVIQKTKRGIQKAKTKGKKKAAKGKMAAKSIAKGNPERPTVVSPHKTLAVVEEEDEDASEHEVHMRAATAESTFDPGFAELDPFRPSGLVIRIDLRKVKTLTQKPLPTFSFNPNICVCNSPLITGRYFKINF